MSANNRFNSMSNRAKLIVITNHFPQLAKGLTEFILTNKMNNIEDEQLAYEVGRKSICGSTITDFLKQENMLNTVNNIVHELVYSPQNIKKAQESYPKLEEHLVKNKQFAEKLLVETVVKSNTNKLILDSVNEKGSVAKRLAMKLGAALNIGKDTKKDAVFSEILKGMNKETFARRNRNGDARTMGAGNIEASFSLVDATIQLAKEKNIQIATEATKKFEEIKQKAIRAGKSAMAIGGLMSVFVFSATANNPQPQIDIDTILQKANIEQVVQEATSDSASYHRNNLEFIDVANVDTEYNISADSLQYEQVSPIEEIHADEVLTASNTVVLDSIISGTYSVTEGDNLSSISASIMDEIYGDYVSVLTENEYQKEIMKLNSQLVDSNQLLNPDLIFPDQSLKIPDTFKDLLKLDIDERVNALADTLDKEQKHNQSFKM